MEVREKNIVIVCGGPNGAQLYRGIFSLALLIAALVFLGYLYFRYPFWLAYLLVGILICIFGILVKDSFSIDRLCIDRNHKRFRYESLFGPLRSVTPWENFPDSEYVSVFYQAYSAGDDSVSEICNVNVWQEGNRHITIFTDDDGELCYEVGYRIAMGLGIPMLNALEAGNSQWVDMEG